MTWASDGTFLEMSSDPEEDGEKMKDFYTRPLAKNRKVVVKEAVKGPLEKDLKNKLHHEDYSNVHSVESDNSDKHTRKEAELALKDLCTSAIVYDVPVHPVRDHGPEAKGT